MENSKENLKRLLKLAIPEESADVVNFPELRNFLEAMIKNQLKTSKNLPEGYTSKRASEHVPTTTLSSENDQVQTNTSEEENDIKETWERPSVDIWAENYAKEVEPEYMMEYMEDDERIYVNKIKIKNRNNFYKMCTIATIVCFLQWIKISNNIEHVHKMYVKMIQCNNNRE